MTIPQGTQFGPYRILELVGSGGMGEVYRAQDTRLGREVAVKLVSQRYLAEAFGSGSPPISGTPVSGTPATPGTLSHRRFLREAQSASVLNHANICTIHDIGEQDGRPYLVMELLRGETLKEALRKGALSVSEVVTFSRQMAGALAAAHAQGVVHRDIKPANIFIVGHEGKRQIKILDFGLAKQQGVGDLQDSGEATATFAGQATSAGTSIGVNPDLTSPGSTLGTVAYMSPEQAEGHALDSRTDLFSLGTVIYEMATGRLPFAGGSAAAIFAALLTKEPPPVSTVREQEGRPPLPAGFDAIVTRLLAKDRQQRYQKAADVERDLDALDMASGASGMHMAAGGTYADSGLRDSATGSHAVPAQPVAPLRTPSSGRKILFAAIAAVVLLAAALFLVFRHTGKSAGTAATNSATGAGTAATGEAIPENAKDSIVIADFVNRTGDPVFDTTLNQALSAQLSQSPVLSIVSQQHLHQSLQFLGKKQDEPITPEIAREIGEREGIKAILTGTIANLGKQYLITLSAQNTATGDPIATVEAQAAGKEQVLDTLDKVATQMRAKLGEDLASIKKLNAPYGQATTPSLEAFRAYALGDEAHLKGNDFPEAADHYKRALELDPKLAMAWARLAVIYLNAGQLGTALQYFVKAHDLTANVSEREKLYINGHYYVEVLGDLDKGAETLEVGTQEYPLAIENFVNLGGLYLNLGRPEKSLELQLKALALMPDDDVALGNVVSGYTTIDQYDEAQKYVAQIKKLGQNGTDAMAYELTLAEIAGDAAAVQNILTESAGRPDQFVVTFALAPAQAQAGQFRAAQASNLLGAAQAAEAKANDAQAAFLMYAASAGWPVGQCQNVNAAADQALKIDKSKATQIAVATALSLCGDSKSGTAALEDLARKYPPDTLVQKVVVPQGLAMLALKAGEPQKALDLLRPSLAFDLGSPGGYIRGLVYLQLHDAPNAIAAFKSATRYRGVSYQDNNPYALAMLGLGRAYAMASDKANAKKSYEKFFELWKNADSDLPVLAEAKKEYAALY
jgi:serine/threonine protein kinase/tetratricopeptide (TPR) repeat protein